MFVWMGLISYLSTDSFGGPWSEVLLKFWVRFLHPSVSAHTLHLANVVLRKLAHVFEFFTLGALLHRAFSPTTRVPGNSVDLH